MPDPDRRFDGSRGHLLAALDASLERLGTDYVDLWQIHAFDPDTPLEETLQALDIAVSSGRARYAGVSNFCGWQLAKAATWQLAAPGIRTRLASTQMEYSLLQRGVEREVLPAALDLGIGLLPSSPLGRGVLTGKYRHATPADSRGASEHLAPFVEPYLDDAASRIVDAVTTAADGLAVTPLQVALAWVRDRPGRGRARSSARATRSSSRRHCQWRPLVFLTRSARRSTMCRRPCTAIPITTGARCEHATPGDPDPEPEGRAEDARRDAGRGPADASGEPGRAAATPEPRRGTMRRTAAGDAEAEGDAEDATTARPRPAGPRRAEVSEAEAELAAQRRGGSGSSGGRPRRGRRSRAGTKLSGTAADLLAAVRAVESGEKPAAAVLRRARARAPRGPRRTPPAAAAVRPRRRRAAGSRRRRRRGRAGGAGRGRCARGARAAGRRGARRGGRRGLREDPWQLLRGPRRAARAGRRVRAGAARRRSAARTTSGGRRRSSRLAAGAGRAGRAHRAGDRRRCARRSPSGPCRTPTRPCRRRSPRARCWSSRTPWRSPGRRRRGGATPTGDGATRSGRSGSCVGLDRYALAEESLADGLARLVKTPCRRRTVGRDWERAAAAARRSAGELIRAVAGHGLVAAHRRRGGPRRAGARWPRPPGLRAWACARRAPTAAPARRPAGAELDGAGGSGRAPSPSPGCSSGAEGPGPGRGRRARPRPARRAGRAAAGRRDGGAARRVAARRRPGWC